MKTRTNEFKEEITKLGKEIDFKFFLYANDKIITQDDKFLMTEDNRNLVVEQFNNGEIEETITGEDIYNVSIINNGQLLSSMMKEVDFEIKQELKIGDVISCQFGLKVGEDYEYIDYGKYMVYSKEFNEDTKTYSYVAFDRMLLSMIEVQDVSIFDNMSIINAIKYICDLVGLDASQITSEMIEEYPNLSKTINEGTFTDMVITYRDVLDMICQALGLSMIVEDKELILKKLDKQKNKEKTITGNNQLDIEDAIESNVLGYSVDGKSEQNGTPTPSSPQEIKTIPSIINHFNYHYADVKYMTRATASEETNGFKLTSTGVNGFGYAGINLDNSLLGKTITISMKSSGTKTPSARLYYVSTGGGLSSALVSFWRTNNSLTTTLPTELPSGQKCLALVLYISQGDNTSTDYAIFSDIQIEEGTVVHEYVPSGAYARVKITGKNLFNKENINWYRTNSSNFIDTGNSSTDRIRTTSFEIEGGKTYVLSGIPNGITLYRIRTYNEYNGSQIDSLTPTNNTFTLNSSVKYIHLLFSGSNFTNDTNTLMKNADIQIEENTEITTYEPYKEREVLIDMSKENLFDKDNANVLTSYISYSGVLTSSTLDDKTIYIPCKPNTTYTISKMLQQPTNTNAFRLGTSSEIPTNGITLNDFITKPGGTTDTFQTITTGSNANYLCAFIYSSSATTTFDEMLDSLKIYQSNNPTPYYELCETGDYKDTLSVDASGNVSIDKKIRKVILNGGESGWVTDSVPSGNPRHFIRKTSHNIDFITPANNDTLATGFSNVGIVTATQTYDGSKNGFALHPNGSFYIDNNTYNNLSTTNVIFYGVLATPETITLPNVQIPLFEGINHITLVDDLETSTSVTYYSKELDIEEIDERYLKDTNVSFGEKYGPVNSVVLSRSEDTDTIYRRDEESIAKNGLCEFKIKDNLIMLYDDREDYIDEIFEQLNGLEYYVNDFSSTGITYLDWLDFYNVKIGDKSYKCLMLDDEIKVRQGLEERVNTEMPEETVTDYKTSSKTDKEVSFIVDKQRGQIKSRVTQGEMESAIEQTASEIKLEVVGKDEVISSINQSAEQISINANKISLAGKTIEMTSENIAINSTNFKVDKDGNIIATSGTFGGTVNTDKNLTVGDNVYIGQNQQATYSNPRYLYFNSDAYIRRMLFQSGSYLSIYSTYNTRLDCNGTGYINVLADSISMSHQPTWPSDKRLKQEIKNIDTSWIDELKVKEFEYIKSPNKKQIGLIAQDYIDKDYSKYFLNENEEGYYGISYGNITNALIQYCQELKKEINSLKEEIKLLKESDE